MNENELIEIRQTLLNTCRELTQLSTDEYFNKGGNGQVHKTKSALYELYIEVCLKLDDINPNWKSNV